MTTLTETIDIAVLEELVAYGVTDFSIAPSKRNASFVALLKHEQNLTTYYFNDERCAAFFALGRSRSTLRPTAVIVTSGTAVAHLLPAAMEAYYTHVPLVLITADRPRSYRGTNAPQSAEQVGIFGQYAPFQLDLADGEPIDLSGWDRKRPLHLNVCQEEPDSQTLAKQSLLRPRPPFTFDEPVPQLNHAGKALEAFLKKCQYPFVTVGTLRAHAREAVAQFLLQLGAPVYLEGVSGLRDDPRLRTLSITVVDRLFQQTHYPIDGILRIGGVPTPRFWRDLEGLEGRMQVFSLNEEPFSCLSWGPIECAPLRPFLKGYHPPVSYSKEKFSAWKSYDLSVEKALDELYSSEPCAEPSLLHALSKSIPQQSKVYLGNSLSIRNWDMSACRRCPHVDIHASRGLSGIDGQLSTFFGLSQPDRDNWAILGDLTALHDLGGWWILPQLDIRAKVVIVNNGGGRIFKRMFSDKEIQNEHRLGFEAVANFWGVPYERWHQVPEWVSEQEQLLIELIPDEEATSRFWKQYGAITQN